MCTVRVTLTQISLKASNHYWIFKQKNFNKSTIFQIPITCNYVLCLHYALRNITRPSVTILTVTKAL